MKPKTEEKKSSPPEPPEPLPGLPWLVHLTDGNMLKVRAASVQVHPSGVLVLNNHKFGEPYDFFAPGTWQRCTLDLPEPLAADF